MITALLGGLAGAAGIAFGATQNSDAEDANNERFQISRDDYNRRLAEAAKWTTELEGQYNDIVAQRPGLTWAEFARDKIASLQDPYLREAYTQAKEEDFNALRDFAKQASDDNYENVVGLADKFSNGKWQEYVDKRNELVMETNAADRYARAYELAAPVIGGASTVKYDNQGRLIENQRATKQGFDIATEVQTQVEQEQKADLRALQQDTLGAAERQQQRASEFMGFFDATGYATAAEADRTKLLHTYQQNDEERAFDMFKMFAGAASGLTPAQPSYVDAGGGNQLISSGIQLASGALSNFGNATRRPATLPSGTRNPY